ncbi:class I SAM-dependent methyltransferase [Kribbella sancticallisti]|uniref:Class I SAM-dependent methyltransferase n=1 Tax=Kribbella sancticallisti TaxID=460087 RepID=A0ABP4MWI3_9ACTN
MIDATDWMNRWDRQQAAYLPEREMWLGLVLDVVEALVGEPRRLVDLASGPGSIAVRAADRFPSVHAVAVDADPFLLELGRRAAGSGRISFRRADLLAPGWDTVLGAESVDVVCSATSLHYFSAEDFSELAAVLARRLRTGGVFVNLDTLELGAEVPRLSALAARLRDHAWDGATAHEDWQNWWAAAQAEPAFAELHTERDRLAIAPTEAAPVTLAEMTAALRSAGFAEVGVLRQVADKHLVVALR